MSVTSSPSMIQVIPRAVTTSQCHRLQGKRSIRAGTLVRKACPVAWLMVVMVDTRTDVRELESPSLSVAMRKMRCKAHSALDVTRWPAIAVYWIEVRGTASCLPALKDGRGRGDGKHGRECERGGSDSPLDPDRRADRRIRFCHRVQQARAAEDRD